MNTYFKSNNVYVFPCAYRGQYADTLNKVHAFNPEARLTNEYNLTRQTSTIKDSYIISWTWTTTQTTQASPATLCCVIGGYYFEIYNITMEAVQDTFLCIKTKKESSDSSKLTYRLGSWESANTLLDSGTGTDPNNYNFNGLKCLSATDSNINSATAKLQILVKDSNNNLTLNYKEFLPNISSGSGYTTNDNDKIVTAINTYSNSASGEKSFAIGNSTKATGTASFSIGENTTASGKNSFAAGEGTIANKQNLTVLGQYNASPNETDLFIVGSGTSSNTTKNILEVSTTKVAIIGDLYLDSQKKNNLALKIDNSGKITSADHTSNTAASTDLSGTVLTYVDSITANAAGKITNNTSKKANFTEGDSQGQFKINTANININNLGEEDSPKFTNLTLTGNETIAGTVTSTGNIEAKSGINISAGDLIVKDQAANNFAIKIDSTGKLIKNDLSQEIEINNNNKKTRFVDSISQDTDGKVSYTTDYFEITDGGQGSIKLNNTAINITNLGITGTPTFNDITLTNQKSDSNKAIEINTSGKLISADHSSSTETATSIGGATITYVDKIITDKTGKITTNTSKTGTLAEGDAQGQFKLNSTNIDIKDLGSTDSPTFNNLTLTGNLTQGTWSTQNNITATLYGKTAIYNCLINGIKWDSEDPDIETYGTCSHAEGRATQAGPQATQDYDNTKTYQTFDLVVYNEQIYRSKKDNNKNHTPEDSSDYWQPLFGFAHAEGGRTKAVGSYSHTEGYSTQAIGDGAHAEGSNTIAKGGNSHAEGIETITEGNCTHAEGYKTLAKQWGSHAEGSGTVASGLNSHAEGGDIDQTRNISAEEISTMDYEYGKIWLYNDCEAAKLLKINDTIRHAFTNQNFTVKASEPVTGDGMQIIYLDRPLQADTNKYSWTYNIKLSSLASGHSSHAEGILTKATGKSAHAEGAGEITVDSQTIYTVASGIGSHAEGCGTTASDSYSHAEGYYTQATKEYAHAEGDNTIAQNKGAHTSGNHTTSSRDYQTIIGEYNKNDNEALFIIGNGHAGTLTEPDKNRSNAFIVTNTGQVYAGKINYNAVGNNSLTTAEYVANKSLILTGRAYLTFTNSEDEPDYNAYHSDSYQGYCTITAKYDWYATNSADLTIYNISASLLYINEVVFLEGQKYCHIKFLLPPMVCYSQSMGTLWPTIAPNINIYNTPKYQDGLGRLSCINFVNISRSTSSGNDSESINGVFWGDSDNGLPWTQTWTDNCLQLSTVFKLQSSSVDVKNWTSVLRPTCISPLSPNMCLNIDIK